MFPPGFAFFPSNLAVSDLPLTMLQPLPGTNRCFYSGDEVLLVNRLPDLVDSEVVRGLDVDSWTGVIAVCVHPSVLIGYWLTLHFGVNFVNTVRTLFRFWGGSRRRPCTSALTLLTPIRR